MYRIKYKSKKRDKLMTISMYIIVNRGLKMSKGKLCSQIVHGIIPMIEKLSKDRNSEYLLWKNSGEKVVIVGGNEYEMINLLERYESGKDYFCYDVIDEGRTEIRKNSMTVLVFNPSAHIPSEISGLKLY